MAERLVRDLAIEEALQEEIKDTLEHNNKSYDEWCAQTEQGKNNNSATLHSYGTLSTSNGSSGCNLSVVGGENQQISLGCWIYLGRDLRKKPHKNLSVCRHGWTAGERFGDWRGSSGVNKRRTRTQQSIIWWMVCSNRARKKQQLFFLSLHDSINYIKHFQTLCTTPHPCHSHFICWLLPIWP